MAWWNVVDWGITCKEIYLTTVILLPFFWGTRRIFTFIISVVFMLLWPKTIALGAVATGRAKA